MNEYKHYMRPGGKGIKLHLGCGDYWFEGYINIDIEVYGGTDLILDITQTLPFQDHVVEKIELYEVFEHIDRDKISNMIDDWKRLLISGGVIKLSVPDLDEIINHYSENKDKAIQTIYGIASGTLGHKWGYTTESLRILFEEHGFKNIKITKGFLSERPEEPKLILEAIYDN